jgi:TPP-dependent pyruvate/acetoin dehydrogenase alpha subunit
MTIGTIDRELALPLENERLEDLYRTMLRIRVFEERVLKEFGRGNIPCHAHLYIGQEAIATGACAALRPDDYIISNHRGHGHLIAKGGQTDRMMAELFGKKTGYSKGKGGSMHCASVKLGILGANGIVGAGITIAGGAALTAKIKKTGQVCLCFFGDGASNRGTFHEGINFASILKLPVVYILENNGYAISVPIKYAANITNLSDRAAAYGIPGLTIDGNDPLAVYEAVKEAVARARRGEGPSLIECNTYRWAGHYTSDPQSYVSKETVAEWKSKDPLPRFKGYLLENAVLGESEINAIHREIESEIESAVKYAEASPYPSPEETLEDVYA